MAKQGAVLIKRWHLDDRGFDTIVLETRNLDLDRRGNQTVVRPVLATEREWYRSNGELEMYHRDLAAYFRAKEATLRSKGWEPVQRLPVDWRTTQRVDADRTGRVVLQGLALTLEVQQSEMVTSIWLVRPSNNARVQLVQVPTLTTRLSNDEEVTSQLGRVVQGWLISKEKWFVIGFDLAPSIYAELRPGSGIAFIRIRDIWTALGVTPAAGREFGS